MIALNADHAIAAAGQPSGEGAAKNQAVELTADLSRAAELDAEFAECVVCW